MFFFFSLHLPHWIPYKPMGSDMREASCSWGNYTQLQSLARAHGKDGGLMSMTCISVWLQTLDIPPFYLPP